MRTFTATSSYLHFGCSVQCSTNRRAPRFVNHVLALAYHFYLNLPAAFTQPGAHLLGESFFDVTCFFMLYILGKPIKRQYNYMSFCAASCEPKTIVSEGFWIQLIPCREARSRRRSSRRRRSSSGSRTRWPQCRSPSRCRTARDEVLLQDHDDSELREEF